MANSQVIQANGVTDSWGMEPNNMARPASIAMTGAATDWATGPYAFDGSCCDEGGRLHNWSSFT